MNYEVRVGRPKGGRLLFSENQVNALPERANASEMSRALGVSPTVVQQFISKGLRAHHTDNGRYTIQGSDLRDWLFQNDKVRLLPEQPVSGE